ncbi:MAPEG family protein [Sinobacterium caligoides]|uniref:MAPEG family protein n=1 Tax=Sinobacterium caligoides TaxID=933926 RepID=A0A3N2DZT3_9GAMM|nr:MAPEG family protein [Sinobacterium caligoides]ROS05376.1 MAPEG family protein [Sinobacterium caligoides]
MSLTEKQSGVLRGIVLGGTLSLMLVLLGAFFNPLAIDVTLNDFGRLKLAIVAALLPALLLAISVGRLAKQRFFQPLDIDGGGLSPGTEQARVLQSLLQNTLEQFCLAFAAYLAWSVVMPARCMSVVVLAAIAFSVGRLLFFLGYRKGAPARALGFALTFYPSLLMLLSAALYLFYICFL